MKTNRMLKVLSLLGFLLLLAPFYDSCNGGRLRRVADANAEPMCDTTAVETDTVKIDTVVVNKMDVDTISNSVAVEETPFYEKAYEFIDDDNSENAYEFAKLNIDCILEFNYKEFKKGIKEKDGYKGFFFQLKNFSFVLICIVTLLIFIFSFKNTQRVHKLSKANLILLFITVICIFLEGLFETISQIKWGYYAFIITNLLIFYYSKRAKRT